MIYRDNLGFKVEDIFIYLDKFFHTHLKLKLSITWLSIAVNFECFIEKYDEQR